MATVRCKGARRDGSPCQAPPAALGPAGFCWAHDPAQAESRRAARAKGGQNRATAKRVDKLVPATLRPVVGMLLAVLDEVHDGRLTPAQASAMAAVAGAVVKVYQVAELEQRVEALEAVTAAQGRPA